MSLLVQRLCCCSRCREQAKAGKNWQIFARSLCPTGIGILHSEMGNLRNGNLIGRNVGRFRYQQSWTQEELAAKMQLLGCYMTRDIIANIENRRSSANDKQIAFLAEALNVEIGDLFPKKLTKAFKSHVASLYGTPT